MENREAQNAVEIPMSPEEARNVMWVRTKFRPIGELFDEGYLNQSRLIWGLENAYDRRIRQACKVLLDQLIKRDTNPPSQPTSPKKEQPVEPSLQVDITIEQARKTPWPIPPYKGQPMGDLLDTKQISLNNLGYAIENAWDIRVRRAAIVLALARMKQTLQEPAPAKGPLRVSTAGRSYTIRQQNRLLFMEGVVAGVLIVLSIGLFIVSINSLLTVQPTKSFSNVSSTPLGIVAIIIVLSVSIALVLLANYYLNRLINQMDETIDNYRKGEIGEDRVVEALRQSLDGDWHLFRNVVLPGRNQGDLDAILISQIGVWVFEIKSFTGEYRNIGEQWEYKSGNRWKMASSNPSRQVKNNAVRLASFLKADNIKLWVEPIVIWANPESKLTVENPSAGVWTLDRIQDELGNLWNNKPLPDSTKEKIIAKLEMLCKQVSEKSVS